MKRSSLEQAIQSYLRCRRKWGFALKTQERILKSFVRYCRRVGHKGLLTNRIVLQWLKSPSSCRRVWRARRLAVVRRFALFWVVSEPRTEIPPAGIFGPETIRSPVHIYTGVEIAALLKATEQWKGADRLRGRTYRTVFGLLRSTRLRISEALGLQNADVDWSQALLTVRRSKFGKSRCLPLHASVLAELKVYARQRDRQHGKGTRQQTFFLNTQGNSLSYSQMEKAFRRLRQHLDWNQEPLPRIHDLRHSFVVETLLKWSAQKEELGPKILALTTYLGHCSPRETYWYLSATPELLAVASARLATAWEGGNHV